MILTPSTCVRVAAGAGSGKSTTLALRVIVLRYYLGAAWDEITVVTFTNKSRDDFIKKLLSNAQLFEPTISKRLIEARVRTFHSLAFRQARAAGLNGNTADRIPQKSPVKDPHMLDDAGEPGAPTDDDEEDSPDTPFAPIAKLDELPVLPEILREVGGKLLGADPAFKLAVIGLERAFLFAQPRAGEAEKRVPRVKLNQARDEARTQEIYEYGARNTAPSSMQAELRSRSNRFTWVATQHMPEQIRPPARGIPTRLCPAWRPQASRPRA